MVVGTPLTAEEQKFLATIPKLDVFIDPRGRKDDTWWYLVPREHYELPEHS